MTDHPIAARRERRVARDSRRTVADARQQVLTFAQRVLDLRRILVHAGHAARETRCVRLPDVGFGEGVGPVRHPSERTQRANSDKAVITRRTWAAEDWPPLGTRKFPAGALGRLELGTLARAAEAELLQADLRDRPATVGIGEVQHAVAAHAA